MVAHDLKTDRATWRRERVTVTPAAGWQPLPGARRRPDAELPAQWRPWSLLVPRLHHVRAILRQTINTMTGRPAGQ